MMMDGEMGDPNSIESTITRIQAYVYPRRIRVKEFFNDYDHLRCGRCTIPQLARVLDTLGSLKISDEAAAILVDHFTDTSPQVQKPQIFHYAAFCAAVDKVFDTGTPGPNHAALSSPGSTMALSFRPNTLENEEREMAFNHVLHRLATLCKTRGVLIKDCYTDCDRAAIASPSRQNPRRGGKVTKQQFMRLFPFKKDMTTEDKELICEKYNVSDKYDRDQGDIHFMALHNDVSEVMTHTEPPFPTSPLHLKPDETEWSHSQLGVMKKIQARVVEKRSRLKEHFKDFDALRKGICTTGQVKTVLTIMDLSKYIDKSDFETLCSCYTRDDGMFEYEAFCRDIDSAFTVPGLERTPLARTVLPDASTTAPARRNKMILSSAKMATIAAIEDKVRTIVRKKGMLIKPIFTDFDGPHRGYVTRSQASRVLATLGFGLTEQEIGMLCGFYCDLGNHLDFNYQEFIKNVDPPNEDVMLAMRQSMQPHQAFKPFPYFNEHGKVKRLGQSMSSPMLLG